MYQLADTGITLADDVLSNVGENYVFHIEARENGYSIHTASCQYEGIGIDTPEDLARIEQEDIFPPKHS